MFSTLMSHQKLQPIVKCESHLNEIEKHHQMQSLIYYRQSRMSINSDPASKQAEPPVTSY
jgi:hypothetical protein